MASKVFACFYINFLLPMSGVAAYLTPRRRLLTEILTSLNDSSSQKLGDFNLKLSNSFGDGIGKRAPFGFARSFLSISRGPVLIAVAITEVQNKTSINKKRSHALYGGSILVLQQVAQVKLTLQSSFHPLKIK